MKKYDEMEFDPYATEHNVYIGYYKDHIIAISKMKEVVKNYLENHRSLKKGMYSIKKDILSDTDLILKYDEYIISEFHGYYIPKIDQDIITLYSRSIEAELSNTIESLKHLTILCSNVKKISQEEVSSMVASLKCLNRIQKNDKLLYKLNKQENYNCSFLFTNIEDYLSEIRRYKDEIEMNRRFNFVMTE